MTSPGQKLCLALLTLTAIAAPTLGQARDLQVCADLYRQLHNSRQIIGNSGEIRRFAQDLAQQNVAIRNLRAEMRRSGCGSGSIVVLGAVQDPQCTSMRDELKHLEDAREDTAAQRNVARGHLQSDDDRLLTLAALRQNDCRPTDLADQQAAEEMERLRIRGIELPKDEHNSSITNLGTAKPSTGKPVQKQVAAQPPTIPGPERPYDPDKKVRTVGPTFLPEQSIDLAHPKLQGPQPLQ